MVRRSVWLAIMLATSCGRDYPEVCEPATEGDRQTPVVFHVPNTDEPPLRICADTNVASRLDATATSPGLDESYAITRPGVIPWTNLTYEDAVLACGRAGKFLCERRFLQPIVSIGPELKWIDGLVPTSSATPPAQVGPIFPPFSTPDGLPDTTDSVAVWTAERDVIGLIRGLSVMTGDPYEVAPVTDAAYKNPLLGFRCCIDIRFQGAFEPFGRDPSRVRQEVDDVPLAK